ncbi:MAG: hypothetical protein OEV31_04035 [Gammaproteobacteria bacterium]|nr:hypothetical protein [Gammaproteobacteria bacterium]
MSNENRLSSEFLNAFVDNQLAAEEKSRAYMEISQSEALNREVCELRKLHDLVQLAYTDIEPPSSRERNAWRLRLRLGIAASVMLALGIALGVAFSTKFQPLTSDHAAVDASHGGYDEKALSVYTPVPARTPAATPESKVLVHITYDDASRIDQALQDIEGLLHYYRDRKQSARVEIVTNGRGLNLLRLDTSRHARKVAALQKEFDNLTFAACQNTLDRIKREQNTTVQLLPGVIVIDSGMAEIMRRQDQGWSYLQV